MLELRGHRNRVCHWLEIKGLHTSILPICMTKLYEYKIGTEFNKNILFVEQNNFVTKIANAYIVFNLHVWQNISYDNFKLKNSLFGLTNITKNIDKIKGL